MTLDIMMPFYGRIDHFQDAVRSVLAQEDGDWRLTIVDDVYPDLAAGEWARAIDDDRVRYIRNETNLRPSRNYNKSIGLARSEFLVLMGGDDIMRPGYVGRVRELLAQHPDVDVVQPGVDVIDQDGVASNPLPDRVKALYQPRGTRPVVLRGEAMARSLLRGNWTYFPSIVWRTERVAGGFRTDLDVVQDLAMLLDIAYAGGSLVVDDVPVFSYRRHRASVSGATGADGTKFAQERTLFADAAAAADRLGWRSAAGAARRHLSSRLNALTELPRARSGAALRNLLRHGFGGLPTPGSGEPPRV